MLLNPYFSKDIEFFSLSLFILFEPAVTVLYVEQMSFFKLAFLAHVYLHGVLRYTLPVPDHDGGRPEEVNSCVLNSYMVYL